MNYRQRMYNDYRKLFATKVGRLVNEETGKELVRLNLTEDYSLNTGVKVPALYKLLRRGLMALKMQPVKRLGMFYVNFYQV